MRFPLTTILALFFYVSNAQWVPFQLSGTGPAINPNTLQVFTLASHGSTIFAGTSAGILLSADSGNTWTCVHPTYLQVRSLVIMGNVILAGTNDGFFRSANGGATWQNPVPTIHTRLYTLGKIGSRLFAGIENETMYVSNDSGISWSGIPFPPDSITSFTTMGSNIYASTMRSGVYLSADSGTTWTKTNSGLSNLSVLSLANTGSVLYAGTSNGQIFASADQGQTWNQIFLSNTSSGVCSLVAENNEIYAGTLYGGVFRSNNQGSTWSEVNAALGNTYVRSLAVTENKVFAGTGGTGIFTALRKIDVPLSFEDTICMGSKTSFRCTVSGLFTQNNTFTMQLSNENGSFGTFKQIATLTITNQTKPDTLFSFIADGLVPSDNYRVRTINTATLDTFVHQQPLIVRNCCSVFTNAPVIVPDSLSACQLEKLVLNVQPFKGSSSYEWTGPKGLVSNLQNPVIDNVALPDSGMYRVRAISGLCGASPQDSVYVTIKPAPAAPQIINGNGVYVANEQIRLSAKASSAIAYEWSNGSTDSVIVLSYSSKTYFNIYGKQYGLKVMNPNGCWSAGTKTAYQVVMQYIAFDRDTVCHPNPVMVTWKLGETLPPMGHGTPAFNEAYLHLSAPDGSFDTYTDLGFTTYSGRNPFSVTFPFNTGSYKPGDRYRLRAVGTMADDWISNYLTIAGCSPDVVTITNPDTVCMQDTLRYHIDINAYFNQNNKLLVQLSDQNGSFTSARYIDTVAVSGAIDSVLHRAWFVPPSVAQGNNYLIRIISNNPADTFTGTNNIFIKNCASGLWEASAQSLFVYPNPVKKGSMLTVEIGNETGLSGPVSISLFDLAGKEIPVEHTSANKLARLNLADVNTGIYYLRIVAHEKVLIQKILIE